MLWPTLATWLTNILGNLKILQRRDAHVHPWLGAWLLARYLKLESSISEEDLR